jgi:four helix bundle protein
VESLDRFLFEDLKVYNAALDLADSVIRLTRNFPPDFRFLKDQLRRAATSISLNIAEGNGRTQPSDRNRFFVISRSSCCACVPIIELCIRNGLIKEEMRLELRREVEEILTMLNGLVRRGVKNKKGQKKE